MPRRLISDFFRHPGIILLMIFLGLGVTADKAMERHNLTLPSQALPNADPTPGDKTDRDAPPPTTSDLPEIRLSTAPVLHQPAPLKLPWPLPKAGSTEFPTKHPLAAIIKKHAQAHGIDPKLVWSVIRRESGFNPQAVSPKGAMGLMQLIPSTASLMGVSQPFDVEQNIAGGVKYLKHCLVRFNHDVVLALAAYNAGPLNVEKYQGCPPFAETRHYVSAVLQDYAGRKVDFPSSAPTPAKTAGSVTAKAAPPDSGLNWKVAAPQVKVAEAKWKIPAPTVQGKLALLASPNRSLNKLAAKGQPSPKLF